MRAVGYFTPGPVTAPNSLMDIELPRPSATGRDLLVEVRAVSVNPVDYKVRASAAPPTFAIHSYPVEKRCPISCNIKGCMSSVLKRAQDSFENSLDGITLADIVGEIRRASR